MFPPASVFFNSGMVSEWSLSGDGTGVGEGSRDIEGMLQITDNILGMRQEFPKSTVLLSDVILSLGS